MEDSKGDEFEEHKINIKLEVQGFNEIEAHDSFDISEDIVVDAIKQEELIKTENGDVCRDTMSNKDTMISDPALSLKMEHSIFEETKNVIKLEETDFKDIDMSDSINQDIMEIMPEKLIIKSENVDSCEENTNNVGRNLGLKTCWIASKSKDDSTIVKNFNCSRKEHDLASHQKQLQHKSATGEEMFVCSTCDYQTNTKGDLTAHKLQPNKGANETRRFRCHECNHQTKYKSLLRNHMLQHKSETEVEMFTCGKCNYRTKYKHHFKIHMLRHKSSTEVELFRCGECSYQTCYKSYLKAHMLRHKSATETEMFSCRECDYQAKVKRDLKAHMLRHKNASETEMLSCGKCDFQSKYRSSLNHHIKLHKMFSCGECNFQAKRKDDLHAHILQHESAKGIEMFNCGESDYQAKFKRYLKEHMLLQKCNKH